MPMANKQKQMLAVWGSPGGGKTVTAVKLALELSKRKKNVVLVFTDVTAPTLPAVVSEKKLPDVSVGELLAAPGMTQEQVLKTCVPCEKNPYISFLGYKAGENVFTHAEYSKEKAVDMLVLLRHIADYVIVDCTSLLTGNVLATTALEVADDVLRVCSCDLKAISYFSSYLSLVADRKFKPEQHIKVLSNTRPYQGGSEYENSFGGVKYRLPYYNQLDERWADLPYGTDNIGGYGCGPTSMAIVVSSLTDQTVDPPTMAEWAYQNGYWCSGNGSYHSLIPGAAEGFGLQWESISTDDPQAVVDALASGKLIVALMSKGHFTSSGHFMVLRGVTSEGKILVADPASKKRSEQEWDISIILDEARKGAAAGGPLWAIY